MPIKSPKTKKIKSKQDEFPSLSPGIKEPGHKIKILATFDIKSPIKILLINNFIFIKCIFKVIDSVMIVKCYRKE